MSQSYDLNSILRAAGSPSPQEIATNLTPLILASTDVGLAQALARNLILGSQADPQSVETTVSAIALLSQDQAVWNHQVAQPADGPDARTTFGQALTAGIAEGIDEGLEDALSDDDDGNLSIDPTNIRLTTALLSASTIKHGVQHLERVPIAIVRMGLQDPDPVLDQEPAKNEVFGVAAIIHLAIVGDRFRQELELKLPGDGVLQALKSLKEKNVFKLPSTVNLLEVRPLIWPFQTFCRCLFPTASN